MKKEKKLKYNKQVEILKKENTFLIAATIIMFLIVLAIVFVPFGSNFEINKQQNQLPKQNQVESEIIQVLLPPTGISEDAIVMKVPAVDNEGNGVVTFLAVEAEEGSGKTLVDIDSLLFFTDTQESILIAKKVSSDITELNLENYDLTYTIYAEANSIGGPSAGAALTIATIAALEKLQIREHVIITGRVFLDGSMGRVSSVMAKAAAAKAAGASLFLVPPEQGNEISFESKKICQIKGVVEICSTEQIPIRIDIGEQVGIEIMEVSTIEEALDYFIE